MVPVRSNRAGGRVSAYPKSRRTAARYSWISARAASTRLSRAERRRLAQLAAQIAATDPQLAHDLSRASKSDARAQRNDLVIAFGLLSCMIVGATPLIIGALGHIQALVITGVITMVLLGPLLGRVVLTVLGASPPPRLRSIAVRRAPPRS